MLPIWKRDWEWVIGDWELFLPAPCPLPVPCSL
jgi:hypothetical protein